MRRRVSLLPRLRALQTVQHFVSLIHTWTRLLFANKSDGVFQVANDAAVSQVQLGVKLNAIAMRSQPWGSLEGSRRFLRMRGGVCIRLARLDQFVDRYA